MPGLAEPIYVLVHRCHEQLIKKAHSNRNTATAFPDAGINTRQGIILKLLSREDGLTQKDLTRYLAITSSSCGELITKLEARGYLEKRRSPTDKRTFTLHLTEAGQALAQQYEARSSLEMENWAATLAHDEQEQLLSLLTKLSHGLDGKTNEERDEEE